MTEDYPDIKPQKLSGSETEFRKIQKLVSEYESQLGKMDIVPVGDMGFLLQSDRLKPKAGNNWVLFDYDDTLAATTEVKTDRTELFSAYLGEKLGYKTEKEDVSRLMKLTDSFSRWEEKPDDEKMYHAGVHMSALSWATRVLSEGSAEGVKENIEYIEETL